MADVWYHALMFFGKTFHFCAPGAGRAAFRFLAAALFVFNCSGANAQLGREAVFLERARAAEAETAALLGEHLRFEEALLAENSDKIVIFFSMPHGARLILEEVRLLINGRQVAKTAFTANELLLLQGRAVQLLYASRLTPGEYLLKLDFKVMQGRFNPMIPYRFTMERGEKYLEIQLLGSPSRSVEVLEW